MLDLMNDSETIERAFAPYYRTTILAEETDADTLHDLKAVLDGAKVYPPEQVDEFVVRTTTRSAGVSATPFSG